jgi:hypothetical protein
MPVTPLPFSYSGRPPDVNPADQRHTPITDLDDVPDDESEYEIPGIQLDLAEVSLAPRDKLLTISAQLNGVPVVALIDSGAQGCFISRKTALRLNTADKKRLVTPIRIRSATGSIEDCHDIFSEAVLTLSNHIPVFKAIVAPISHDLILGKQGWLTRILRSTGET